jgi:hypothetical protein
MIPNFDYMDVAQTDNTRPRDGLIRDIQQTASSPMVNQAIDLLITEFMNGEPRLLGPEAGQFDHYIFEIFMRQFVWSVVVYNMVAFRIVLREDEKVAVIMEPFGTNRIVRGYNEDKSRVVYDWVYDKDKDGNEVTSQNVPANQRVYLLSMNAADINQTWFNSAVSDLINVVRWMQEAEENERDAHYAATHPLSHAVYRESNVRGSRPTDPVMADGLTDDLPQNMLAVLRNRFKTGRAAPEESTIIAERVAIPKEFSNKRMRAGELVAFTEKGYEVNMAPLPTSNSRLIESNYFVRRIASRIGIPMNMLMSSVGGRHNIEDSRNEMAPLRASVARIRKHLDDAVAYISRVLFDDAPDGIFIQWAKDVEITSIYMDAEKRDAESDKDDAGSEQDSSESDEPEHDSGSEHGPA